MYRYCNINPLRHAVGDCVIRAISIALDQQWDKTYWDICDVGFEKGDMPSANQVWGEYLRRNNFKRHTAPDFITVSEFCEQHPCGTFILGCESHVVCVIDGCYYDTWNSGDEYIIYYWG